MNFIGWIRDLFGIQKDMYETKKTRLEIEKIEDEKREKLITPATFGDVKKYDPNTRKLLAKLSGKWKRGTDDLYYDDLLLANRAALRRFRRRPRRRGIIILCSAYYPINYLRIGLFFILVSQVYYYPNLKSQLLYVPLRVLCASVVNRPHLHTRV